MRKDIVRIQEELNSLGYRTEMFDALNRTVVSFDYTIETGPHKGMKVTVGLSLQETGYPEYPPHWIHVTPPLNDRRGGAVQQHSDPQGREWLAMSRPPGVLWDQLPTKHMNAYIEEHLRRIWMDA